MVLADSFYYQPVQIDTINTRVNADLFAKEGDVNGRGILLTLTENGLVKDTTGIALNLKWEHMSVGNQGVDNFEAVDLSKGLYKITYPIEMLNLGTVRGYIQIIDSGKSAGIRNLRITIERGVGDDTVIVRSDSFAALTQALIDVNNLEKTYANELNSVKQQLADKADLADLPSSAYTFKGSTTFALLPTTGNTLGDVYWTTDNALNYSWTGTEWTPIGNGAFADKSVTNGKLADWSVTSDKTDFLTEYTNLYNYLNLTEGNYYNLNGSIIHVATGGINIATHPPIHLKAGKLYSVSAQKNTRCYLGDKEMNWLSTLALGTGGGTFTPTQDCYLYSTISTNLSHDTLMITEGALPSAFQAYGVVYKRVINNLSDYASAEEFESFVNSGYVSAEEFESFVNTSNLAKVTNDKLADWAVTSEKTDFLTDYSNLYNDLNLTKGNYYNLNGSIIQVSTLAPNVATHPPIHLKAGKLYSVSSQKNTRCYLGDKEMNWLSTLALGTRGGTFTTPQDCYLYFTVQTNLSHNTLMITEGALPSEFQAYGVVYKRVINNLIGYVKYTDVHVKKDGTGDFLTVSAAIASLSNGTALDQTNVYIHDGVYEENIPGFLPNFVNLIGYSGVRENVEIRVSLPATANDADITAISTLNLQQSNSLKNLTITARNMRYAIHSESANAYKDWTQLVENCHIEHYGNQDVIDYRIANSLDYSGVWTSPGAWVEGASSGAYAKFTRCTFVANTTGGIAWSVHNNVNFAKPMLHILEDCKVISKKYGAIKCEGLASGQNDKVYIKNCLLDGNIYCTNSLTIECIVSGSTPVPSSTTNYFAKNSTAYYAEHFKYLLNNSGVSIPAGTLVCYAGDNKKVRKMLSTDSASVFAGFTIGDTGIGEYATILSEGFYRYLTAEPIGTMFGVDYGALSLAAQNKIGVVIGNGFVKVKNPVL